MSRKSKSRYSLGTGFILIVVLMALISIVGQQHLQTMRDANLALNDIHSNQTKIVNQLQRLLQQNTLITYQLQVQNENNRPPHIEHQYKQLGQQLRKIQPAFETLPPSLGNLYENATKHLGQLTALHSLPQQQRDLDQEIETNNQLAQELDEISEQLNRNTDDILSRAEREYKNISQFIRLFDVFTIALAILVAALVMRRTSRVEKDLFEQKQHAQITLQAIGEAVIAVDSLHCISYLNPVAEELSGWSSTEALGRPFDEIIQTYDERSGNQLRLLTQHYHQTMQLPADLQLNNRFGVTYAVEGCISPLRCQQGECSGEVIVFRDVTESRQINNQLTWQAQHDVLTSLVNRREFERRLSHLIERARHLNEQHALLYIDLDQFKIINDTCGHEAGDKLLQELSEVLQHGIRQSDTLARLGGDEFGLLLENCQGDTAVNIANHLLMLTQNFRFAWQESIFKIGASVGIVIIDAYCENASEALRQADAACFVAKDQGRNRVWMHSLDDNEISQRHGEMQQTSNITRALEENRFQLFRQLIRPIDPTDQRAHYELLLRMIDSSGQLVPPMAFIPAAERFGIMTNIDKWVIGHTLQALASGRYAYDNVCLWTINISAQSLTDDSFLEFVLTLFESTGTDPRIICFEITETAAIANWVNATRFINELKQLGCQFALDDFGSGMSSFSYLKKLNIDFLKIDGSFVRNITHDKVDHAMVEAIHQIGHVLGVQTIAEFVENDDILNALEEIGIDFVQGHGIHEPEAM